VRSSTIGSFHRSRSTGARSCCPERSPVGDAPRHGAWSQVSSHRRALPASLSSPQSTMVSGAVSPLASGPAPASSICALFHVEFSARRIARSPDGSSRVTAGSTAPEPPSTGDWVMLSSSAPRRAAVGQRSGSPLRHHLTRANALVSAVFGGGRVVRIGPLSLVCHHRCVVSSLKVGQVRVRSDRSDPFG